MNQLFINGIELQLSDSTKIGVTYQANNVGELQQRQGNYTNVFKILINDHNNAALEWSSIMASETNLPYEILKATYLEDGVEIISEGKARIKEIQNGFYLIAVTSGNIDLKDAIGDTRVGDLYANDDSFIWSRNSIINSRDGSKYYIFPFIDWRTDINTFFNDTSVDSQEMIPCATMTGFIERLSGFTGFTFSGSYLDSDDHKKMILTPNAFSKSESIQSTRAFTQLTDDNLTDAFWKLDEDIPKDTGLHTFTLVPNYINNETDFVNGRYVSPTTHTGRLQFRANIIVYWLKDSFFNTTESQLWRYQVILKDNLGNVVKSFWSVVFFVELTYQEEFTLDLDTGAVTLMQGRQYFVEIKFFFNAHTNRNTRIFIVPKVGTLTPELKHTPAKNISLFDSISFGDLFTMKIKDVLSDVMNKRGLVLQTNNYSKVVQLNFFQDLIDNKAIAKDWSNKVEEKNETLTFTFGKYKRRNWMRFKPNEFVEAELGDYYFDIVDENIDDEIDVVKFHHPATQEVSRGTTPEGVFNIPTIEALNSDNKWQKPGYRILQMDTQAVGFDVDFNEGVLAPILLQTNIPFAKFVGTEELIPVFYEALTDILTKTKGISLPIKLSAVEIQELDFTIPIYLYLPNRGIDGYFYLNIIDKYQGGVTTCQLIRL